MWIAIQNAVGARQGVGGGPGPTPPPYTPPLDSVTAAVAYSVRKLNSTYSGNCMLVRRVSDGATQGIGFDSNGLIDVNALATFSGGSELTVKVWYDQAGGGFDLEQSNDAYLPTIYDGAAVTTSTSGKPCVRIFRIAPGGPGEWLITDPVSLSTAGDMDVFLVLHGPLTSGGDRYFWNGQAGPTTSGARWGISYTTNSYVQQPGPVTSVQIPSTPVPDNLQFILNAQFNPSGNINTLVGNGTEFGTYVSSTTYRTDPYNVALGARVNGTEGYNTFDISEIIHLPNYGVSNNESINNSINDYYQFTNLPYYSSGLLADYPGAAAAYSVRQLNNTAIKCMRVRKNAPPYDELDIGFTAGGDLDEAAIVAFGGSDVLTVSRWYDQSGGSVHATQVTPRQPTIFDGTSVVTDNGKPAIDFDGLDDWFEIPSTQWSDGEVGVAVVINASYNVGSNTYFQTDTSILRGAYGSGNSFIVHLGTTPNQTNASNPTNGQRIITWDVSSGNASLRYDGAVAATQAVTGSITTSSTPAEIGRRNNGTAYVDGTIQELVVWRTATNIPAIETNINEYYTVNPNGDAATSGFLFDYPGATFAYSIRQLNNNAEYCMQVIRADGATLSIGFDGSGYVDTAAIVSFAGGQKVYLNRMYDQTGNQYHSGIASNLIGATTFVTVYDGTNLITKNGQLMPQIDLLGNASASTITSPTATTLGLTHSLYAVVQRPSAPNAVNMFSTSNTGVTSLYQERSGSLTYGPGWTSYGIYTYTDVDNEPRLYSYIRKNGTDGECFNDGVSQGTTTAMNASIQVDIKGCRLDKSSLLIQADCGGFQEMIAYSNDRTAVGDNANILANIKAYYPSIP